MGKKADIKNIEKIEEPKIEESKPEEQSSTEKGKKKGGWNLDLDTGSNDYTFATGVSLKFDLIKIFPKWEELTDTQKRVIGFGVSKKVSNSIALAKELATTETEKTKIMNKTFDLIVEGKWSVRRPKEPAVTIKEMTKKIKALPKEKQEAALAQIKELGFNITLEQ